MMSKIPLALYAKPQDIHGNDDFVPLGIVPREWLQSRVMGSAAAHGKFADIDASEWIEILRRALASLLSDLGIPDFDASVLQRANPDA